MQLVLLIQFCPQMGASRGVPAFYHVGTFLSFFTAQMDCFARISFVLTTEGEFIIKNAILLAVLLFLSGPREVRQ